MTWIVLAGRIVPDVKGLRLASHPALCDPQRRCWLLVIAVNSATIRVYVTGNNAVTVISGAR